jgi:hypothetical protein
VFDEMKIKSSLVYDKNNGEIVGFGKDLYQAKC